MKRYVIVVHIFDPPQFEVFDSLDNVMSTFDITWANTTTKPTIEWADVRGGTADIKYLGTTIGTVSTREVYDAPIHF